jgi:hypothetical protein
MAATHSNQIFISIVNSAFVWSLTNVLLSIAAT